jgi:hypothetical protein
MNKRCRVPSHSLSARRYVDAMLWRLNVGRAQAMKILPGGIARSVYLSIPLAVAMLGVAGAAHAQSGNADSAAGNAAQIGAGGNGSVSAGAGLGIGSMPAAGAGVATASPATGSLNSGATVGAPTAPALSTTRANGTSLYMSPDPRAPNVSGRAAPAR